MLPFHASVLLLTSHYKYGQAFGGSDIPESQLESVSHEGLLGICAKSPVELYFLLRLLVLAT